MAVIMKPGDTVSKIFTPRAGFSLTIQLLSGEFPTGKRLYYSDDGGETWNPAQDQDFSTAYTDERYSLVPQGYQFQIRGGSAADIRATIAYIAQADPSSIKMERDVLP